MSVYTYAKILERAKTCQTNVKKNKKNGIDDRWSYYIAKAIIKPHKDIERISVTNAPDPKGTAIHETIKYDDYINICKRYVAFIEDKENKKHALPNWVTYKNYKIRPYLLNEILSRILVYYDEHGKMPSNAKFDSDIYKSTTKKLWSYITEKGCKGMGQCTSVNCACNSLQQSFYRLTGILVDESTIAGWAGTTSSGTSHAGIETAVAMFNKKYNKNVKIKWYNFNDLGKTDSERWSKIQSFINNGAMFMHLLYRDQYGHYEVIKGVNEPLTILNSLGSMCTSVSYCGYIEYREKAVELRYMKGISQKSIAVLTNG